MRRPQDKLGQRQLVFELKHAIDRCRRRRKHGSFHRVSIVNLERLILENPTGIHAVHVRYNIGVARREWLDTYLEGRVRDARPSAESTRPGLVGANLIGR